MVLEAVSKNGFWLKIPSSPKVFAETGKAGARFNPEVRLRRIEGHEPSAQSRRKRREANPPQADLR